MVCESHDHRTIECMINKILQFSNFFNKYIKQSIKQTNKQKQRVLFFVCLFLKPLTFFFMRHMSNQVDPFNINCDNQAIQICHFICLYLSLLVKIAKSSVNIKYSSFMSTTLI